MMNLNTFKQAVRFSTVLGLSAVTLNSFAQTALDRGDWSLSSNRSQADLFSAIDGNPGTRWSTNRRQTDGQYFQIDMNEQATFGRIVLDTTGSDDDYPREYEVSVSSDGSSFTTIAAATAPDSDITEINFTNQTARFIRIDQNGSDNRHWWSIHEINVYEDDGGPGSGGATDFTDTGSWVLNSSNNSAERAFAIDGNGNTRWDTAQDQRDGQFFEINFNSTKTFNQLSLDTSGSVNDYPRGYEVQVSDNGNNFTTIATGTPSNNVITNISFPEQSAQYLRIVQT